MFRKKGKLQIKRVFISISIFCCVSLFLLNVDIFNFHILHFVSAGDYNVEDDTWLNLPSLFFGLIQFVAWLITFCVDLINWSLSPTFVSGLLDSDAIYNGWSTVRDFLNIFFIFFLLFSAFATVFQVSKYHIKSTWVMIVVMALMVNFSWPITRVIIDVSNVSMSYMMGQNSGSTGTSGNSLMAKIGSGSKFAGLLIGQDHEDITLDADSYPVLFLGLFSGFLFLVTMGAIALILVVRGFALAILLVFASIGFTMAAFPTTRSYANQWWSALIKYAFMGPLLLFMIILSVSIISAADTIVGGAPTGTGELAKISKIFMQYSVALIILWSGIIMAGKLGDVGTSMVIGKANAAVKWGGRKMKSGTVGGAKFVGRRTDTAIGKGSSMIGNTLETKTGRRMGFSGRAPSSYARNAVQRVKNVQEKDKKNYDNYIAESNAVGMASAGGKFGGDKNAVTNLENKKVAEMKKKWKDDNVDNKALMGKMPTATGAEQRALTEFLSSQKDFGKGQDKDYTDLMKSLKNLPVDLRKNLEGKMSKEGKAHLVHDQIKSESGATEAYNRTYKNMNAESLARNTESLQRAGSAPGSTMHKDFSSKLDQAGFARDFQKFANNADSLKMARAINPKHFT